MYDFLVRSTFESNFIIIVTEDISLQHCLFFIETTMMLVRITLKSHVNILLQRNFREISLKLNRHLREFSWGDVSR